MYRALLLLALSLSACKIPPIGERDAGPPPPSDPVVDVEPFIEQVCAEGVCPAADAVLYWRSDWSELERRRVVTLREGAPPDVTDREGNPAELVFQAGAPATIELRGAGAALGEEHTFTSPAFFRTAAWRRIVTRDVELNMPTVDSVAVHHRLQPEPSARLELIPLVPGTYSAWCELGTSTEERYEALARGEQGPDLSAGHAGAGEQITITVEGELEVELDPGFHVEVDRETFADPRRSFAHPVWATADTSCAERSIKVLELDESRLAFSPADVQLTTGTAYAMAFENDRESVSKHFVTAPELFANMLQGSVVTRDAEVRAPALVNISLNTGARVDLNVLPLTPMQFVPYCAIEVEHDADGTPDLTTGHAGDGAVMSLSIVDEVGLTGCE